MWEYIRIFFGFADDPRTAEGWFSPTHLLYATGMVILAVLAAVFLGKRAKRKGERTTRRIMIVATCLMLFFELFKIVLICIRNKDPLCWLSMLPLFLCSIMLFAIPIATFAKGRVRQSAIDFSFIFGPLCMLAGNYLAANYFADSPVFRFDSMVSVTTHSISGFFGLFVMIAGLVRIEKRRIPDYCVILGGFELLALAADLINKNPIAGREYESNYMFFRDSSGTPFSIFENIAGGPGAFYTVLVALSYFAYLFAFLGVYFLIRHLMKKKRG